MGYRYLVRGRKHIHILPFFTIIHFITQNYLHHIPTSQAGQGLLNDERPKSNLNPAASVPSQSPSQLKSPLHGLLVSQGF